MRWLVAGACLLWLGTPAAHAQVDVWIDTDPSVGMVFRDADDGFALVQAFHSPELHIRGISATYGNASLKDTQAIARDLAKNFGSGAGVTEKSVFAGAASAEDLGRSTAATDALAAALVERPLTYLALGPFTDLASLIKLRPELAARVSRVVFIGGRLPGQRFYLGNRLPYEFHDANFEKDTFAALTVLRSNIPVELVPVAASKDILFTPDDIRGLGETGGAAGRFLKDNTKLWLWSWRTLFGLDGGPAFDSLAVLAVTHPEAFEDREMNVCVSANLNSCQPIAVDDPHQKRYLLVTDQKSAPGSSETKVLYHASTKPGAKQMILDALLQQKAPALSRCP